MRIYLPVSECPSELLTVIQKTNELREMIVDGYLQSLLPEKILNRWLNRAVLMFEFTYVCKHSERMRIFVVGGGTFPKEEAVGFEREDLLRSLIAEEEREFIEPRRSLRASRRLHKLYIGFQELMYATAIVECMAQVNRTLPDLPDRLSGELLQTVTQLFEETVRSRLVFGDMRPEYHARGRGGQFARAPAVIVSERGRVRPAPRKPFDSFLEQTAVPIARVKECAVCNNIFWAGRISARTCGEKCSDVLSQRQRRLDPERRAEINRKRRENYKYKRKKLNGDTTKNGALSSCAGLVDKFSI